MNTLGSLETDVEQLGEAMRLFFQTMKRPQQWARITAQAGVNLDRPAGAILHMLTLHQSQPFRLHDLAAQLGVEAPSVTRKTQELEQRGYIRRQRDPHDGRAIGLVVTPRGRSASQRLWRAQQQPMREALNDWPVAERRQFVKLFQQFSQTLAAQSLHKVESAERSL